MTRHEHVQRRDRGLRLVRRGTATVALSAVLAVGALSGLAAATKPGSSRTSVRRPAVSRPAPSVAAVPVRHHRRHHRHHHVRSASAAPPSQPDTSTASPSASTAAPQTSAPAAAPQPPVSAPQPAPAAPPAATSGGS